MTSTPARSPIRPLIYAAAVLAVIAIAWTLRANAVKSLPIDFDEDDYMRAGQQYAEAIQAGDWSVFTQENYRTEHPPLNKILYGFAMSPLPPTREILDRPSEAAPVSILPIKHLRASRTAGAVLGTLAVALLALLNPIAGLSLAIHTFTIKYTAQVMLESVPLLTSALCVVAYERSRVYAMQGIEQKPRLSAWLILSALMLGLTAASKYLYCVVGIAILAHWIYVQFTPLPSEARGRGAGGEGTFHRLRSLLPLIIGWGIISLIAFFAADPYLWPDPITRLRESVLFHGGYAQSQHVQNAGYPTWQPIIWLFSSAYPWHPDVFTLTLDLVITLFALLGLPRLARRRPLYVIWIAIAMIFLLIWPTKWPQYILVLMFPWSLAAGEGFMEHIAEPLIRWITQLRTPDPQAARANRIGLRRAFLWLLPGVLVIALITYFPLIFQSAIAMTDLSSISLRDGLSGGIWREVSTGLAGEVGIHRTGVFDDSRSTTVNYVGLSLLTDVMSSTGAVIAFEVLFTIAAVAAQLALGIAVALMLSRPGVRFKGFWYTLFILPWGIPEFVGIFAWTQIVDPRAGWLVLASRDMPENELIRAASDWMQNPISAFAVIVMIAVWTGWPLMMLAASAGLKTIPREVHDAAMLDGASSWYLLRFITWPMLLPLLAPVIILRGISAFNQFYLFYLVRPPFPMTTLSTLAYDLVTPSFFGGWYGASAAVSIVTVIVLFIMLIIFNRWSKASAGVTYV